MTPSVTFVQLLPLARRGFSKMTARRSVANSASLATADLGHPLYLDMDMLLTFLAAIEDGVAHSSEVAVTVGESNKKANEGSGAIKLPSVASLLGLNLSVDGKLSRESGSQESVESKMVRQHTAASLFNRLRRHLKNEGSIRNLTAADDLAELEPGALVEVTGTCEENPILRAASAMKQLMPYFEANLETFRQNHPKLTSTQRKDLASVQVAQYESIIEGMETQAKETFQNLKIAEIIENDIRSSPIVDLVMRAPDFAAVVSAGREYFTDELVEGLKGGTYKLIGKVNAINTDPNVEVPVTRRGGISLIANAVDDAVQKIEQAAADTQMNLTLPSSRLCGRYIQVVPLAIYI